MSPSSLKALKALRGLRALRPLRVITHSPGMKTVVSALIASIPGVSNVVLLMLLFYLVFAILGVQFFKGTFWACRGAVYDALPAAATQLVQHPAPHAGFVLPPLDGGAGGTFAWPSAASYPAAAMGLDGVPLSAPNSRDVCLWLNATWGPTAPQSFDNVGAGMLTLFEMSTTEGWVEITRAMVDASTIGGQVSRPRDAAAPACACASERAARS